MHKTSALASDSAHLSTLREGRSFIYCLSLALTAQISSMGPFDPIKSFYSILTMSNVVSGSSFDDTGSRQRTDGETHKANVQSSYLAVKSFLVEKYWTICDAALQPSKPSSSEFLQREAEKPAFEREKEIVPFASVEGIRAERRKIANALLQVLSSSEPIFLELNSFPLCMKIRQIASTVTDFEVSENKLTNEFLKILSGLEKGGAFGRVDDKRHFPSTRGSATENEENELRKWADLSENQMQYVTLDALLGSQKKQIMEPTGL